MPFHRPRSSAACDDRRVLTRAASSALKCARHGEPSLAAINFLWSQNIAQCVRSTFVTTTSSRQADVPSHIPQTCTSRRMGSRFSTTAAVRRERTTWFGAAAARQRRHSGRRASTPATTNGRPRERDWFLSGWLNLQQSGGGEQQGEGGTPRAPHRCPPCLAGGQGMPSAPSALCRVAPGFGSGWQQTSAAFRAISPSHSLSSSHLDFCSGCAPARDTLGRPESWRQKMRQERIKIATTNSPRGCEPNTSQSNKPSRVLLPIFAVSLESWKTKSSSHGGFPSRCENA